MINKPYLSVLFLSCLMACVPDNIIRIQTDQSFEGEEMYQVSRVLDEYIYLISHRFPDFMDEGRKDSLPDCPSVTVIEEQQKVVLNFSESTCQDSPTKRKGAIMIDYPDPSFNVGDSITFSFQNYSYDGFRVSGTRTIKLVAQHRERRVFEDTATALTITNPKASSTEIDISFSHAVNEAAGVVSQLSSTGSGRGRNHTGRHFEMEVTENKIFGPACMGKQTFRPSSGSEKWVVDRTSSQKVEHRLSFHADDDCQTHSIILLDEGVEMRKTP